MTKPSSTFYGRYRSNADRHAHKDIMVGPVDSIAALTPGITFDNATFSLIKTYVCYTATQVKSLKEFCTSQDIVFAVPHNQPPNN